MKVLFAVSNESISESIIKRYQQEYKEIISSKNVYYFNAIAKELQKDKSYDRIVISEDLEPFANNNYEVIDKFIFEKLDDISDEATSNNGQDIPIILICADRREKSEALLIKIFGIGIYSALLGQDRSVTKVCELINKPRSKKDAKIYYHIDSEDVEYKAEGESDVSEIEIQNILNHYKRLGKNEEQYVNSFDNIAAQYTDAQLRVICKFLPLNVKAVLEASSEKYQQLITFGTVTPSSAVREAKAKQEKYVPNSDYQKQKASKQIEPNSELDVIERNIGKSTLTKPVVIPVARNIADVKKVEKVEPAKVDNKSVQEAKQNNMVNDIDKAFEDIMSDIEPVVQNNVQASEKEDLLSSLDSLIEETPSIQESKNIQGEPKRRRGRPRKVQPQEGTSGGIQKIENQANVATLEAPKKKRGRPRKVQPQEETSGSIQEIENQANIANEPTQNTNELVDLFDLGNEEVSAKEPTKGIILPGFDEEDEMSEEFTPITQVQEPVNDVTNHFASHMENPYTAENTQSTDVENTNHYQNVDFDSLLTRDKKVVAFVGTSKNGTSFLVNNLAETLSRKGIRTAILDLTKNKNAYYIYTQNEEELRRKAFSCVQNLRNGIADGIQVNKNLTVFTTLPGEDEGLADYQSVLATLAKNYSVVLMDCDFMSNYGYFDKAQEIYLVQSFDILTIQPLTAFLRDLKTKNILNPEKLRVILNKVLRVRTLTEKTIIGGMAYYNDPAMSFMTELFNKDTVRYCVVPFEEQTYSRYLEGLVNCQITTNGYSKNFMMSLEKLSNMVYPLLSNGGKDMGKPEYNKSAFSSNMNATLNKMKNNY